ncbi:MAG: phosphoglycerate dehydrogenase [Deltaproteobacteria bacterium]|nr:phosphoglycerate dehydrogenase [Deltaproteobacteria bacterium]
MYIIATYNQIASKGLDCFARERFEVGSGLTSPDGILVRSYKILPENLDPNLKALARAGAGVDKICVDDCTNRGIVVFNTPGANANSVKELTMLGLLLSTRGVIKGARFLEELKATTQDPTEISKTVEQEKKRFAGNEIKGKTLGIVGLGAIGSLVADMALSMGMSVLGYDPGLSVESAWRLSNQIQKMDNLPSLLGKADFVTLHLPMLEATKDLINKDSIQFFKKGAVLLNFSREGIVDNEAVLKALKAGILSRFISDFPTPNLMGREDTIFMPHIGASTQEAEENCAIMASKQLIDFLENGNIVNSVNFPQLYLERLSQHRIVFANKNIPNMLGQVLPILAESNLNVLDMLNKSRGEIAYSVIDVESSIPKETIDKIKGIEGILSARAL